MNPLVAAANQACRAAKIRERAALYATELYEAARIALCSDGAELEELEMVVREIETDEYGESLL